MLKTVVDFWLLALSDQVLITVPSTFGENIGREHIL